MLANANGAGGRQQNRYRPPQNNGKLHLFRLPVGTRCSFYVGYVSQRFVITVSSEEIT